jgi:hypothetical protein
MKYLFRCTHCGYETTRDIAANEPLDEVIECSHFAQQTRYANCEGTELRRVFEMPNLNLGYRPAVHDRTEQFRFKNL